MIRSANQNCPCAGRAAGLGDITTDFSSESGALAAAPGFDWHWIALALLATAILYFAWPKPEKERRNVEKRRAKDSYEKRLRAISEGK